LVCNQCLKSKLKKIFYQQIFIYHGKRTIR